MKDRELWIDYLRSFIILTVVIHHATLAYTTFASFNSEAYIFSTNPIVDVQRWIGFDILVYFNDIFFMSLMFLISGFFVVSNLRKKGPRLFINGRFRRLFIPFITGVTLIALLAYYPSYIYSHEDRNILKFIVDFVIREFWPPGPAWFLWVLYIFNVIIVWVYPRINTSLEKLGVSILGLANRPVLLIIYWFLITWIQYVPMRLLFGPDAWTGLGPFDFQISRVFLYFGYFILGTIVGTIPLEKGVLSDKSSFMRQWPLFLFLALFTFILLLAAEAPLKKLVQDSKISDFSSKLIYCSIFVASCIFSCAAYLTTAKAIFIRKSQFWDMLTSNSFTIYLIHYIFIIWGQYILLSINTSALIKFIIVAPVALVLSILISHFIHKSRAVSKYF
jgi:glucans biosynthesis protein C